MNAFSVLLLEFIVSRAHLRTKCNSKSRLQPVSASVPLRWSDERSLSFFQDTAEVLHHHSHPHPHNMKQITKPIRIPSENHFITAGKARSASRQPLSLDKLPEQYLIGQWPREPYQPQPSCMSDKATQTPGFWTEDGGEVNVHKRSASWGSADHLIEIAKLRQQLQRSLQGSCNIKENEEVTQLNQVQPKRLTASSTNMIHSRPLICRMPSYSDCINQELESVFICEDWGREEEKPLEVRDGGRAPVPPLHHGDLHHTHSTETQMSCSPCFCCSPPADTDKDYRNGSPLPQFSSSPKPNNSYTFKREPPEGCEKVKVFEDLITCRTQGFPIFSCPDRNKVNFTPSGSAFCPVKLLCSSLFPSDAAARPSPLDNHTSDQMSGPQNSFPLRPVASERCSIRKCLLLS
ncbi:glucocorticoid-induced transcript 1 protein [Rhinichthys klamathensis goyatoka]|uniref:glucocorticoid-induced transcript 1 protein n=1 Tax=Rhinichthys klamathensis goyatoka TaxID=3034132 RepID=UPI0024B5D307|nr:glucocorticoid-induced transcript 1 protein [Rhinichthys klamathensis goyatoka]